MTQSSAGQVHARDLDEFVARCDRLGGIADPRAREWARDFSVVFTTAVDIAADPFSATYWDSQRKLHAELSGRAVDQEKTELTPINADLHAQAINPYNSKDPRFIARHKRAVLNAFLVAGPESGMSVLDLGCGWGLTSEAMAYCGAHVTAVDINPQFVELVGSRATRLGLPIAAERASFDDFESTQLFDLIFFYECLHHSLKPWETIRYVARFLKPRGRIVWAGEPVNDIWWKSWGLRLDAESVYVMRKFGWWESGWSTSFITECFSKAGMALSIVAGAGLDGGPIGFAVRNEEKDAVKPDLSQIGLLPTGDNQAIGGCLSRLLRRVAGSRHS
jgi:2-polyprenyl-3-methyl-5-hydroxy-6-metoxy-1,4-benzoquinol methylase